MPKRKHETKIMTPDAQGDDSYIVIKQMTLGDFQIMQDEIAHAAADESDKVAMQFLGELITGWNWVDGDDNPLPQPTDVDDIDALFQLLTPLEIRAIVSSITNTLSQKKGETGHSKSTPSS